MPGPENFVLCKPLEEEGGAKKFKIVFKLKINVKCTLHVFLHVRVKSLYLKKLAGWIFSRRKVSRAHF